jgi:hypothetical protein
MFFWGIFLFHITYGDHPWEDVEPWKDVAKSGHLPDMKNKSLIDLLY